MGPSWDARAIERGAGQRRTIAERGDGLTIIDNVKGEKVTDRFVNGTIRLAPMACWSDRDQCLFRMAHGRHSGNCHSVAGQCRLGWFRYSEPSSVQSDEDRRVALPSFYDVLDYPVGTQRQYDQHYCHQCAG